LADVTELPPLVDDVVGHYLCSIDQEAPGIVEAVYLTGSVALGDFRPGASDIDFVAVTTDPLGPSERNALRRAHRRVSAHRRRPFFDGAYVTWRDLRADPAFAELGAEVHEARWSDSTRGSRQPVSWHELAWHGVAVRGPDRSAIEVWTDSAALVDWTRGNMASYWRPWHARASRMTSMLGIAALADWGPAWGVLGVARQRYTIATGRIISKHGAGLFARETFGSRWHRIIDECVRIRMQSAERSRYANPFERRREALEFVKMAIAEVLGP
jgi:hypothetical protein